MTPIKRQTACIHLYMHPEERKVNIYMDGQKADLEALLVTAARMDDRFHDAFLEGAAWLRRDENAS